MHQRQLVVQPLHESYRYIPLTQGKVVIVDIEDYEFLSTRLWRCLKSFNGRRFYAVRWEGTEHWFMHRIIIRALSGEHVDHKNGNGLDNRKENIRRCTPSQNNCNRGPTHANTCGLKGVSWDKSRGLWTAHIQYKRKQYNLGRFDDPTEAAKVYDEAARSYFGEFARLNFPSIQQD